MEDFFTPAEDGLLRAVSDRSTYPGKRRLSRSATLGSMASVKPKSVPVSPRSPRRIIPLVRSAWHTQMGSGLLAHGVTGQLGFVMQPQKYWSRAEEVGLWTKDESRKMTTAGYTEQERAAAKIARLWLSFVYRNYVDKVRLADRLELEDKVAKGVQRLLIYGIIAVFIVGSLMVGIPNSEKLQVRDLLRRELQVDAFEKIGTLKDLRDVLPGLSQRFKPFSMSSNDRFSDETTRGRVVLRNRVEFVQYRPLFTFDPDIASRPFTFAAWVERLPGSGSERVSILRKPMASDRALSCWGWFDPPQFRFGAHDFHAIEQDEGDVQNDHEEVVGLAGMPSLRPQERSHEVMVVTQHHVTFYRNGKQLGQEQRVPRAITDCVNPDVVELGHEHTALSAVKYYPRALKANEVSELWQEGAPLVDIATGSLLSPTDEDELLQVGEGIGKGKIQTLKAIEVAARDAEASRVIGDASNGALHLDSNTELDDPTFPFDPSPVAALPKGLQSVANMLPDKEQQRWEAGGRPVSVANGSWHNNLNASASGSGLDPDSSAESGSEAGVGEHFSLFEAPIHTDGSVLGPLPVFDANATGMALSFWFKPHTAERVYGPALRIESGAGFTVDLRIQLDWVTIEIKDQKGARLAMNWMFLTKFDHASGKVDEQYLLSAFAQTPAPVVWRHILYQWDSSLGGGGGFRFFLDGNLAFDVTKPGEGEIALGGEWNLPPGALSVAKLFDNAMVRPHNWEQGASYKTIAGKVAQMRFFPRVLSAEEVAILHRVAVWPGLSVGVGAEQVTVAARVPVRQCIDPKADASFFDTNELDAKGHPCAWYASVINDNPYVCSAAAAKRQCPVTCNGRRICHDGSLHATFSNNSPRKRYGVFDRIRAIRPPDTTSKQGSPAFARAGRRRATDGAHSSPQSVLCVSDQVDRKSVVAECRELAAAARMQTSEQRAEAEERSRDNFAFFYERTFEMVNHVDARDCDALEARLEDEQCTWDGSWLPEFEKDFKETQAWSLSFWVKPVASSLGMPTNFWFAINFFASLAPPVILNHWNEIKPLLEPWMDTYTVFNDTKKGQPKGERAAIWPTAHIDYANAWTMMYVQLARDAETGQLRLCGTLNAIALQCKDIDATLAFNPRTFLQAVEFTTAMLVSPIQVDALARSPQEVQQMYYRTAPQMEKQFGPAQSVQTKAQAEQGKTMQPFDSRVVLIAPPLIFASRALNASCDGRIARPVLREQLQLLKRVHCSEQDVCANADKESLISCRGAEDLGLHFGREPTSLFGHSGHAEFFFSIADNAILVRDGRVLETARFVDSLTHAATIFAVFLSPASGLTSELVFHVDMSGQSIFAKVEFHHLGPVPKDMYGQLGVAYGILFFTTALLLLVNLLIFKQIHHVAVRCLQPIEQEEMWLIIIDVVLGCLIMAFTIWSLIYALGLEDAAFTIVQDIALIPFAVPAVEFRVKVDRFFEVIEKYQTQIEHDKSINMTAFVLMFFVLVRIVGATAVHPRLKVLVGSLMHALNDLWHFALVLLLIYSFFSLTSLWLFGDEREDFRTFGHCFLVQFEMLMGRPPQNFLDNSQLTVFTCFSIIVQFFLMRHFLIGIIMGGYQIQHAEIQKNAVVNGFLTDAMLTTITWFLYHQHGWPSRRRMAYLLRNKVSSRRVNYMHLRVQLPEIPTLKLRSWYDHYSKMPQIACDAPAWVSKPSKYVDTSYKYFVKQSLADIWNVVVTDHGTNVTSSYKKQDSPIVSRPGGRQRSESMPLSARAVLVAARNAFHEALHVSESQKGSEIHNTAGAQHEEEDDDDDDDDDGGGGGGGDACGRHLSGSTAANLKAAPLAQSALDKIDGILSEAGGAAACDRGESRASLQSLRSNVADLCLLLQLQEKPSGCSASHSRATVSRDDHGEELEATSHENGGGTSEHRRRSTDDDMNGHHEAGALNLKTLRTPTDTRSHHRELRPAPSPIPPSRPGNVISRHKSTLAAIPVPQDRQDRVAAAPDSILMIAPPASPAPASPRDALTPAAAPRDAKKRGWSGLSIARLLSSNLLSSNRNARPASMEEGGTGASDLEANGDQEPPAYSAINSAAVHG